MARTTRGKPRGDEPAESYTMTRLAQVRALADPLRVRILELLSLEPRTTKQVAELLGEKPTRLYHHVEALARIGLIRLTETRPVRGTVEKYYQAVARSFRADSRLFRNERPGSAEREALTGVVTTILERTADELRELIRSGRDEELEEEGMLSLLEVKTTESEISALRDRLKGAIEPLEHLKDSLDAKTEGARRYRLTIAFFPLDPIGPEPPGSPKKRLARPRRSRPG